MIIFKYKEKYLYNFNKSELSKTKKKVIYKQCQYKHQVKWLKI